jgi:hypothetical protein
MDLPGISAALSGVEFVMEAVTFAEFIMEEALQTAFFALKNAMDARQYDLARMTIDLIQDDILVDLDTFSSRIGYLAPYSWPAFQDFAKSCHHMLNTYKATLNYF